MKRKALLSIAFLLCVSPSTDAEREAAVNQRIVAKARRASQPRPKSQTYTSTRVDRSFMHGVAKPLREVAITSPSAGTIGEVFIEDGARVEKGQPLLEFDLRLSEARLGMAEAEHQRSKSAVKATELEYRLAASRLKNTAEAYRQGAATDVELLEAQIRWQQARARYKAAIDEVKQAEEGRKFAEVENQLQTISAPFKGIVVQVFAVPGQSPTIQDKLLQLVDTTKLRVEFYVPVKEFHRVRGKTEILLQAESPVDEELRATIVVVDHVIEPATQTIRCVLEIDNSQGKLPAGFRVRM